MKIKTLVRPVKKPGVASPPKRPLASRITADKTKETARATADRMGTKVADVRNRLGPKVADVRGRLSPKAADVRDRLGTKITDMRDRLGAKAAAVPDPTPHSEDSATVASTDGNAEEWLGVGTLQSPAHPTGPRVTREADGTVSVVVRGGRWDAADAELTGTDGAVDWHLHSSAAEPPLTDKAWRELLAAVVPRWSRLRSLRLRLLCLKLPTDRRSGTWRRLQSAIVAHAGTLRGLALDRIQLPHEAVLPFMETVCTRLTALTDLFVRGTDAFWSAMCTVVTRSQGDTGIAPALSALAKLEVEFPPAPVGYAGDRWTDSTALWSAMNDKARDGRLATLRIHFAEYAPTGNFYLTDRFTSTASVRTLAVGVERMKEGGVAHLVSTVGCLPYFRQRLEVTIGHATEPAPPPGGALLRRLFAALFDRAVGGSEQPEILVVLVAAADDNPRATHAFVEECVAAWNRRSGSLGIDLTAAGWVGASEAEYPRVPDGVHLRV